MRAMRTVDRNHRLEAAANTVALAGGSSMMPGLAPPFPVLLERAMKRRGWTARTLATMIQIKGVTEQTVLAWLNGESVPYGDQWAMLKGQMHELHQARRPREEEKNPAPITEADLRRAEQLQQHELEALERDRRHFAREGNNDDNPPRAWGVALWYFRVDAGITVKQLAKFLKCSETAVLSWQSGHTNPVADNVRQIYELLPKLGHAVADGKVDRIVMREMAKPPGRAGRPESRISGPITLTPERPAVVPEVQLEADKPVKPSKEAAITPIRRVELAPIPTTPEVIMAPLPRAPEPMPAPPAPIAAPVVPVAPVAPLVVASAPAPAGETDQQRIMRELFKAMTDEAEAQAKLAAANKILEDLQLAVMQAEEDCKPHKEAVLRAQQARENAHAELQRIAAATVK